MRDIVLTLFVLGLLPVAVARPWIGILAWVWFGLMNPHTLAWGFARGLPFGQLIAAATLLGVLLSGDRKPLPRVAQVYLLAALWLVFLTSTIFAIMPDRAWEQLVKVSKIFLFIFLSMMYFQDRKRLRYLFIVIAFSIGFYGIKGGIFALVTGGVFRVYGPGAGFFSSNNSIGLALNTILPILFFLAREETNHLKRLAYRVSFWLCAIGVLFTYSRGAFLGLIVVMGLLYLKSRRVLVAIAGFALLYMVATPYLPERWTARMGTIETHQDTSAQNRLIALEVAWKLALDNPILGAGFWGLANRLTYAQYGYALSTSAHNLYLDVLADHGFPGFIIYVSLFGSCFWELSRLKRRAARDPAQAWVVNWCLMLQASLIAYLGNGVFQSAAYADLHFQLAACVVLLRVVADQEKARLAPAAVPAPTAARPGLRVMPQRPAGKAPAFPRPTTNPALRRAFPPSGPGPAAP